MVKINKESDIWQKVIKPNYPLYKQRLECKGVGDGTPDIMLIKKDSRNLFVECKFLKEFNYNKEVFYLNSIKIRPSQLRWFLQYPNEACFVICGEICINNKYQQKFIIVDKKNIKKLYEQKCLDHKVFLLDEKQLINELLNYGR